MSYIGWVQAGGAWALRVLPFQILSKSLPAACVCRDLKTLRMRFLAFHVGFLFCSIQELGLT